MALALDPLGRGELLPRLREQAEGNRLPQSLLLLGPLGCGKEAAALALARLVLCLRTTEGQPACADTDPCPACHKSRALTHPDLLYVCPVERSLDTHGYRDLLNAKATEPLARLRQPSSAVIPIGTDDDSVPANIRSIRRFVQVKPFEGRRRVVIIGEAHRMNRSAANALLKTLEEPPSATLLILCTHQPHLLPITVRSRCAKSTLGALSESEIAGHLEARHGIDAEVAERLAAASGGDARRALDLVDPHARQVAAWASTLLGLLVNGDGPGLLKGAELLAKGQDPAGGAKKGGKKKSSDSSLSASRDLGMRALDFLIADLVVAGRIAAGRQLAPSHHERLDGVARALGAGGCMAMSRELMEARADLARNVNVALVLTDAFWRCLRRAAA